MIVISNDDYFAAHLITKIEDDYLFVRSCDFFSFSLFKMTVFVFHQINCDGTTVQQT